MSRMGILIGMVGVRFGRAQISDTQGWPGTIHGTERSFSVGPYWASNSPAGTVFTFVMLCDRIKVCGLVSGFPPTREVNVGDRYPANEGLVELEMTGPRLIETDYQQISMELRARSHWNSQVICGSSKTSIVSIGTRPSSRLMSTAVTPAA